MFILYLSLMSNAWIKKLIFLIHSAINKGFRKITYIPLNIKLNIYVSNKLVQRNRRNYTVLVVIMEWKYAYQIWDAQKYLVKGKCKRNWGRIHLLYISNDSFRSFNHPKTTVPHSGGFCGFLIIHISIIDEH